MTSTISEEIKSYFTTRNFKSSFLISFEGIEGSGKSTQIQLITEYFKNKNKNITYFREPGGTNFGEKLRLAILESKTPIDPLAESYLFASSRAQLLTEKVIPLLEQENQIVILDRYIDSSIAYQGIARGLGAETILDIHKRWPLNLEAHCTIYLKIDLETSLKRQSARGNEKDYFEKENKEFYQNLIDGYNQASEIFPNRIMTIDGKQDEKSVHNAIIKAITEKTGVL